MPPLTLIVPTPLVPWKFSVPPLALTVMPGTAAAPVRVQVPPSSLVMVPAPVEVASEKLPAWAPVPAPRSCSVLLPPPRSIAPNIAAASVPLFCSVTLPAAPLTASV